MPGAKGKVGGAVPRMRFPRPGNGAPSRIRFPIVQFLNEPTSDTGFGSRPVRGAKAFGGAVPPKTRQWNSSKNTIVTVMARLIGRAALRTTLCRPSSAAAMATTASLKQSWSGVPVAWKLSVQLRAEVILMKNSCAFFYSKVKCPAAGGGNINERFSRITKI
jgi:hypothetical protein